jgi:hypothetical protein
MFDNWSTLRWITFGVIVATCIAWIVWDVIAVVRDKTRRNSPSRGATISEVTLGTVRRFPVIAFLLGVISGHLFWPQTPTDLKDCKPVCAKICKAGE